jgi:branched-chain amino acid transport system permease protein
MMSTVSLKARTAIGVPVPMHIGIIERLILPVLVGAGLIALPFLHPGYRILSLAASTGVSVVALCGLAILFGQAGIMSVGHAALMGVGAYAAAIASRDLGLGFFSSLPIAAFLSAAVAGLVGLPSLRVGGHHFVIITFAMCGLFTIVLTNGGAFTGSATGLDVQPIGSVLGIDFARLPNFYLLVLGFVAAGMAVMALIIVSPYGRTLRSIRENEALAAALGVNVGLHKILAFMVSGAFAGVAGVLQLYYLLHISPDLYGAFPSITIALMVMLGGARLLFGPLVGALIVSFLPEVLNLDPVDARIAYGIGLILVILLLPGGVMAGLENLYLAVRRRMVRS